MIRITSFSAGVQVPSATLNGMQDRAMSLVLANTGNDFSVPVGGDGLFWQASSPITAGSTQVLVDGGDWHDRIVWGWCIQNTKAANSEGGTSPASAGLSRIGQSLDYNFDYAYINSLASNAASKGYPFYGYLGKGGYSTTSGSGTPVSSGNPPTRGSSGVTSWFVNLATNTNLCLFVDPSSYKLYLYNNTGFDCQPTVIMNFTAATGKRT